MEACFYGDNNNHVKELQKNLTKIGIDCGPIDGKFGNKTRDGVISLQRLLFLDGEFNELTLSKFEKYLKEILDPNIPDYQDKKFNKKLFIKLCREEGMKGYHEGTVGSYVWNNFIKEWDENAGYGTKMYAWCAMYIHEMLDRAGLNLPYYYKGHTFAIVGNFRYWASKQGFYHTSDPLAGDLIIFNRDRHIGMVLETHDGFVVSSEGNSKDRLAINKVYPSQVKGYITIPDGYQHKRDD